MKIKNLFAIAALLLGTTSAFAAVGDEFSAGSFRYKVVTQKTTATPNTGTVKVIDVNGGAASLTGEVAIGTETITQYLGTVQCKFTVVAIDDNALQGANITAVTLGKSIETIGIEAFKDCSNLKTLTIEEGSQLKSIGADALSTTQIAVYDFRNCSKLADIDNNAILESGADKKNTFVTTVYLPVSTSLKDFGTALSGLPNLETTNISDLKIENLTAEAFKGDAKLKSLVLPSSLKTIETNALQGSSIATLTVDVTSIEEIEANVYGSDAAKVPTSLTFKGKLTGEIAANAFAGVNKLTTLNMKDMSFGSKALIDAGAFSGTGNDCKVSSLVLGDIADNQQAGTYTIAGGAFSFPKLASVTIGNITANEAIDANAFGDKLESVKIGNVYSGGLAINDGAFLFAKNKDITVEVGNVRATNDTPVFGVGAFTFNAATDKLTIVDPVYATITFGAIEGIGNNFAATNPTFANAEKFYQVSMTFKGDIAKNGIDVKLMNDASRLTTLTFNGKVGETGIGQYAFQGIAKGNLEADYVNVNFNGLLVENAIDGDAFLLNDGEKDLLTVNYNYNGTDIVTTDCPFGQGAFKAGETDKRVVTLNVKNAELAQYIRDHQITPATAADIIYTVKLVKVIQTLVVYQNRSTNTSYGRFLFDDTNFPDGIEINRHQNGITYTLYTTYVEDDTKNRVVTVNMQPIPSFDGKYVFGKTWLNTYKPVILVKATGTTKSETEMEYTEYDGAATDVNEGIFIPADPTKTVRVAGPTENATRQQIIDGTSSVAEFNTIFQNGKQVKDIYFIINPAAHLGIEAPHYNILEDDRFQVNPGNFYLIATRYAEAAAARIVWLDEVETAIQKVETKAAVEDGVMYSLQGVRLNGVKKGQLYIMNGKKYIAK